MLLQDSHAERNAGNGSMAEKTMDEHKVAVRMLAEFLAAGTPANSITRDDIRRKPKPRLRSCLAIT